VHGLALVELNADKAGVRPVDVREYLATLRAAGTVPATLQRRCGGLVIFFRWAQATALVRSTPMVDIAVAAIDPPTRVALRSSELRRLLRSVHQHGSVRDIAICELLAATGLRVAELARRTGSPRYRCRSRRAGSSTTAQTSRFTSGESRAKSSILETALA
jgi:site-specific recombinase XerD